MTHLEPIYDRDGITLYQGDCTAILPLLDGADHILTDPPYARDVYARLRGPKTHAGSGTPARLGTDERAHFKFGPNRPGYHGFAGGSALKQMAAGFIGSVDDLIAPCSVEFARLCARWCVVFSDAESTHLWRSDLEAAGMRYVRTGAWVKDDPMPQFSGDRPAVGFEPCTITHAQGPMRWNGGGHAAVWRHGTVKGNARERSDHPCPKPLSLMLELVSLFTDPGDLVLDPFMGSGTTGVACAMLGRRFIGIELSEEYAAIAARRIEAAPVPLTGFTEALAGAVGQGRLALTE